MTRDARFHLAAYETFQPDPITWLKFAYHIRSVGLPPRWRIGILPHDYRRHPCILWESDRPILQLIMSFILIFGPQHFLQYFFTYGRNVGVLCVVLLSFLYSCLLRHKRHGMIRGLGVPHIPYTISGRNCLKIVSLTVVLREMDHILQQKDPFVG
ncbi:hypothetical protein F5148DRAFT_318934 [Russula earlei]|uniref:Uncharacterized protein n=1 Tax=Russula earlei TaxID=71964 RepID=A0ACC0U2E3_9AGAM|nr:hypothetical protein F5148DRAFT_318934 [Russula earlei]